MWKVTESHAKASCNCPAGFKSMAGPSIRIRPAGESSKAAATTEEYDTSHRLITFLQSQSQNTLTRLYQKSSSCLSIFRSVSRILHLVIF